MKNYVRTVKNICMNNTSERLFIQIRRQNVRIFLQLSSLIYFKYLPQYFYIILVYCERSTAPAINRFSNPSTLRRLTGYRQILFLYKIYVTTVLFSKFILLGSSSLHEIKTRLNLQTYINHIIAVPMPLHSVFIIKRTGFVTVFHSLRCRR